MVALLRLIGFLVLCVAASRADAATFDHADEGEARAVCAAAAAATAGSTRNYSGTAYTFTNFTAGQDCSVVGGSTTKYVECQARFVSDSGTAILRGCSTPNDNWDRYRWPSEKTCILRNAELGTGNRVYFGEPPSCVAGCEMSHGAMVSTTVNGVTIVTTDDTRYTGDVCSLLPGQSEPPKPTATSPDTDQACTPAGNGQTACIKPSGEYCATASTGATFCWGPTQTGEQAAGNSLQRRVNGPTRPSTQPSTPPPPDSTWNPNSSHTSNSPTRGSFTIINYSTTPGDDGHTDTGGVTGPPEEGEDEGSVSGGETCDGPPPICTGNSIDCATLLQAYLTRCWTEKLATGEITSGIACSSVEPLVCTNLSPAQCAEKAWQKKQACSAEAIADAVTGEAGEGEDGPAIDPSTAWVDGEGGSSGPGDVELDQSGWLSNRSCPTIPPVSVFGETITFDIAEFCGFLQIGAGLVLLFAAVACARILGSI